MKIKSAVITCLCVTVFISQNIFALSCAERTQSLFRELADSDAGKFIVSSAEDVKYTFDRYFVTLPLKVEYELKGLRRAVIDRMARPEDQTPHMKNMIRVMESTMATLEVSAKALNEIRDSTAKSVHATLLSGAEVNRYSEADLYGLTLYFRNLEKAHDQLSKNIAQARDLITQGTPESVEKLKRELSWGSMTADGVVVLENTLAVSMRVNRILGFKTAVPHGELLFGSYRITKVLMETATEEELKLFDIVLTAYQTTYEATFNALTKNHFLKSKPIGQQHFVLGDYLVVDSRGGVVVPGFQESLVQLEQVKNALNQGSYPAGVFDTGSDHGHAHGALDHISRILETRRDLLIFRTRRSMFHGEKGARE